MLCFTFARLRFAIAKRPVFRLCHARSASPWRSSAGLSHAVAACGAVQVGALLSPCPALQFQAMPSLCYAGSAAARLCLVLPSHCHARAMPSQCFAALRFCSSLPFLAIAVRFQSLPSLSWAIQCLCSPRPALLCPGQPCFAPAALGSAYARIGDAMPTQSYAMPPPRSSMPELRLAIALLFPCRALLRLSQLRHSLALLCHAGALRIRAPPLPGIVARFNAGALRIRAFPPPVVACPSYASAWRCKAKASWRRAHALTSLATPCCRDDQHVQAQPSLRVTGGGGDGGDDLSRPLRGHPPLKGRAFGLRVAFAFP